MKFFIDLTIAFIGLILLVSTLFTLFSVVAYFSDANLESLLKIVIVSVPVMIVCSIIAWWKKEVFVSMVAWLF